MRHSNFPFGLMALMLFVATVSCNRQTSDVSYYWNPDYEYGTFYPSFMGKIDRAENGKGFGVKNDDCELWADCYLIQIEGEDSLVFPQNYLKGANKASVVLDTTYQDNGIAIMNKVIAYEGNNGPMFYEISCGYPVEKEEKYGDLFRTCISEFPRF